MHAAPWPEPDPQVAAAIEAMYGTRKTPRPLAVLIRDRLGQWLDDEAFAAAFGTRGKPGWSPSRLALVTVLQRADKLTDRQAADAVRMRLDWKYLLGLPAGDPGFDHTVLPGFRGKVADAGLEQAVLDALLARLAAAGLVTAGGKQRTDSTHVIAAVAALNRLELVGESVRAALEALAAAHPDWLAQRICVPDFARRYGTPMTSWRPPASQAKRDELAIAYARDGYALLEAVYDSSAPAWLREIPAVEVLRRVLVQNYTRTITGNGREVIKRREKEPEGDGLPRGHLRIASPYDSDARWGVKREEFWLGYKLHVTETCDDPPPCSCRPDRPASRPAAGDEPDRSRAAGREHDKGCAQVVFPNLITHVATTDATVTDNQMTGAIHDDPLDVNCDDDGRWLECLVWPGEGDRAQRLAAAIATARRDPPVLHRGDLLTGLPALAARAPAAATLVVYHSAVLAYLTPADRRRFAATVRGLPVVWLSNEGPGVVPGLPIPPYQGAPFVLARDGHTPMALTDSHGTWLQWLPVTKR
jgi:transposase